MWVSRRSMHPTHWLICAQVAGCTPQEQWDNIPLYGKLQIFVLIGMLESYGEGAGQPDGYVHYMRGGKPGFYPEIKGTRPGWKSISVSGAHFSAMARTRRKFLICTQASTASSWAGRASTTRRRTRSATRRRIRPWTCSATTSAPSWRHTTT